MKRQIAISLAFILLLIAVRDGIIFLGFKINQQWVIEKKCLHTGEYKLSCKGKCRLQLRLVESQGAKEQNSTSPHPTQAKKVIYYQTFALIPIIPPSTHQTQPSNYLGLHSSLFTYNFFHPPEAQA